MISYLGCCYTDTHRYAWIVYRNLETFQSTVVREQQSTSREHPAVFLRDMHRAVGYLLWIDKLLHSVVDGLAPPCAAKAGVDAADGRTDIRDVIDLSVGMVVGHQ